MCVVWLLWFAGAGLRLVVAIRCKVRGFVWAGFGMFGVWLSVVIGVWFGCCDSQVVD